MKERTPACSNTIKKATLLIECNKCDKTAPNLLLNAHKVTIQDTVACLDALLDKGLTSKAHLNCVVSKASRAVIRLGKLMLRISGSSENKRRLLTSDA